MIHCLNIFVVPPAFDYITIRVKSAGHWNDLRGKRLSSHAECRG
ncbi:hypothetical protein HOLDEFILI_00316 [Holdemania filiformis DSM 12042]|uniref:Uncharacterized protein n=1 Tax=Holdemania filiformis DSM 12042 TaxID=545696 RepID=B9Y3E2_9FIRM|nr:hypothetical protein HOLDEFILI_00316 [Holdemania filiformis DSM 12042]